MLTAALVAAAACLLWPDRGGDPGADPHPADGEHVEPSGVAGALTRVRRASARGSDGAWVADFAEVVAVGLDAGLDLPEAAIASACSPGVRDRAPWLAARLRDSIESGRGVSTVLDGRTDLAPAVRRDLDLLLAAWRLAEEVGAAASAVTASAAASVRERRAAADRTAVVVAGPRASMLLLSALPLAGPAAALVVGLAPGRLYDSAPSRLLAVGGLALTGLGWWWARGLLRRAARPGRTEGPPT